MARKMIDCRKVPSDIGCTLTIAGSEDEFLDAAVAHAVAKHGHQDAPELREMLRGALETTAMCVASTSSPSPTARSPRNWPM